MSNLSVGMGSPTGETKSAYSSAYTQSITADTYGQSIPVSRGARKITGQILWSTSVKQETKTSTTTYGSDLGYIQAYNPEAPEYVPPDPITNIETTGMFVDCHIGFGAPLNPDIVAKLMQLIVGNTITYDDTGETLVMPLAEKIVFFTGSEEQLPDPLAESYLGVGNVPAYRGEMYVSIKKLDLLQYGGVFPTFIAYIADQSTSSLPFEVVGDAVSGGSAAVDYTRGLSYWLGPSANQYTTFDINRDQVVSIIDVDAVVLGGLQANLECAEWFDLLIAQMDGGNTEPISTLQASTGAVIDTFGTTGGSTDMDNDSFSAANFFVAQFLQANTTSEPQSYVIVGSFLGGIGMLKLDGDGTLTYAGHDNSFPSMKSACRGPIYKGISLVFSTFGTKIYQYELNAGLSSRVPVAGNYAIPYVDGGDGDIHWLDLGTDFTEIQAIHWYDPEQCLLVFVTAPSGDKFLKINLAQQILMTVEIAGAGQFNFTRSKSRINTGIIGWNDGTHHYLINIASGQIIDFGDIAPNSFDENYWDAMKFAFYGENGDDSKLIKGAGNLVTAGRISIPTLLTELAEYIGFDTGSITIDPQLNAYEVDGFDLEQGTDFITLTTTWGVAYLFDVTETGDGIAFRSKVVVTDDLVFDFELTAENFATINQVDFPRNTDDPFQNASIVTSRIPPTDVYDTIALTYFDFDYGDQVTYQRTKARLPGDLTPTGQTLAIAIPELIMRADEGASLVSNVLFDELTQVVSHNFRLGIAYATIIPGDLIHATIGPYDYKMRVSSITYHLDYSSSITADDFQSGVALIEQTGQTPVSPPPLPAENDQSQVIVMDMPLLRASDNVGNDGIAIYYGIGGFGQDGWVQADLYRSDNGGKYDRVATDTNELVFGRLLSAIAAVEDMFAYDEVTTFTFYLETGDPDNFATITEANWLSMQYAAIVGRSSQWEYISIREMELVPGETRKFACSGLLRGLRDTYMNGDHAIGDRIVFNRMNGGLKLTVEAVDRQAATVFYKGIGRNQDGLTAPRVSQAVTAEAQRPMSVVAQRAVLDSGDDDVTLSWHRQSRLQAELKDSGVETDHLEFATEEYELIVYDGPGGSAVRTVTVTGAQLYLYTVANQITDGFSQPISEITFKVTQQSDEFGPGRAIEVTKIVERS